MSIRAGSDIAFLGDDELAITNDRYFKDDVIACTNGATMISDQFRDTEDLDGLFFGYNRQTRAYDNGSWQHDKTIDEQALDGCARSLFGLPEAPRLPSRNLPAPAAWASAILAGVAGTARGAVAARTSATTRATAQAASTRPTQATAW
jgi:hypothetical protein